MNNRILTIMILVITMTGGLIYVVNYDNNDAAESMITRSASLSDNG